MQETIRAIQQTPIPTLLIVAGLLFILLGFTTRLGGMIEVSENQKKLAIPIGLLILTTGLVLHFNTASPPTVPANGPPMPADKTGAPGEVRAVIDDPDGYTNIRSGQGSDTTIVARVNAGEVFFTIPQSGREWWPVRTQDGRLGYIHRSRIRLGGAGEPPR